MKKILFTILFGFLCVPILMAQITDSNTEAINQYFQVNMSKPVPTQIEGAEKGPDTGSFVEIVQTGNQNNININSLQAGDEQTVIQSGQKNNYEYYNYYSKENSSMEIMQEGALNSVQVFGENSLMKNAKIKQKSDFKSIVVKNYTR